MKGEKHFLLCKQFYSKLIYVKVLQNDNKINKINLDLLQITETLHTDSKNWESYKIPNFEK